MIHTYKNTIKKRFVILTKMAKRFEKNDEAFL